MPKPDGLMEMWAELASCANRLDLAITLVFLRQLLDPALPKVAGNDPRSMITFKPSWAFILADGNRACWLDALAERINELYAPLLTGVFESLPSEQTERAMRALNTWSPSEYLTGGDLLGELLQRTRPTKIASGSFFTPYSVARSSAMVLEPHPGEPINDPACGSGRLLLACLQICRETHGGREPLLCGVDEDADAVRVCRLNLILAGYRPPAAPGVIAA